MTHLKLERMSARLTRGICWASLVLGIGTVHAAVPESVSDFAKIAEGGFTRTVDGSLFVDPFRKRGYPSLVDNPDGQTSNTYSWSGATQRGDLFIGSNVDAVCIGSGGSNCRVSADGGAQIWKYDPSRPFKWSDWGLGGEWEMIFKSPPAIPPFLLNIADALGIELISEGLLPPGYAIEDLPRDFGYRNMTTCRTKDGVERIYVATAGLPGLVLYRDAGFGWETFREASKRGLNASLLEFIGGGPLDIGYRGLACFKGRLVVAPAASLTDPDLPTTPTVLMNDNPTKWWSPWVEIANVQTEAGVGNEFNQGVFQIEAIGDNLYVSVANRTDGFELWQGDGRGCLEVGVGDGHCNIVWKKLISGGAGRPIDPYTQLNGPSFVASPGATLGVFGNDLYLGASESGFATPFAVAEMLRVRDAETPNPTWELLMGWPRQDWAPSGEQAPNGFVCPEESVGDMANALAEFSNSEKAFWQSLDLVVAQEFGVSYPTPGFLGLLALDDDLNDDDCFPTTGAGPGYGTSWEPGASGDASETLPYMLGPYQYFWRFSPFQPRTGAAQFYVGTLDQYTTAPLVDVAPLLGYDVSNDYLQPGFDLLRTADGETFDAVTRDGFGSGLNGRDYGVRTLLQVPNLGLVVGTANGNPDLGTDVYIGTRTPYRVPPYADAGPDQFLDATDPPEPLNAGRSHSAFDGGTPVSCEWFTGTATVGCRGDLAPLATPASCDEDVAVELDAINGADNPEHALTVKVTDEHGRYACDTMFITAGSD